MVVRERGTVIVIWLPGNPPEIARVAKSRGKSGMLGFPHDSLGIER